MLQPPGTTNSSRLAHRAKNEKARQTAKEERNILHIIKIKRNYIGHILPRNCLIKHAIEGNIKGREEEEEDVSSYWMALRQPFPH
jgi:hypothetical protein